MGTAVPICFVVVGATACGADRAASEPLDTITDSPTTPISTTPIGPSPSLPPASSATIDPSGTESSDVTSDTAPPTLDLDGVVPASIPMVISEHLDSVQQAVRADIGGTVFAGSAVSDDENSTMIIYGTDIAAITTALDRIDTPLRDRITVVETRYSIDEIEAYADEARSRLEAAGIQASVMAQSGVDAVVVHLETPDGLPDDRLEADAAELLSGIPSEIGFSGPIVPF